MMKKLFYIIFVAVLLLGTNNIVSATTGKPLVSIINGGYNITENSATIKGVVSPFGLPTDYYFTYWSTTDPKPTEVKTIKDKLTTSQTVSTDIGGSSNPLTPGTKYYFAINASNSKSPVVDNITAPTVSTTGSFTTTKTVANNSNNQNNSNNNSGLLYYFYNEKNELNTTGYSGKAECITARDEYVKNYCAVGTGCTSTPVFAGKDCVQYSQSYVDNLNQVNSQTGPGVTAPPGVYTISPNNSIQYQNQYKLLAPIGTIQTIDDTTTVGDYLNVIFQIIIGLCGVLAVIMIIIGGIQWMGNESVFGKVEAKSKITNAIFGLLLALGAWALLNTINPALLGGNGVSLQQKVITLEADIDQPQTAKDGKFCNGKYQASTPWPTSDVDAQHGEQKIRDDLKTEGITVPGKVCTLVGEPPHCTSVAGLNITKVVQLKKACGASCDIVVTGGTECWLHGGSNSRTNHMPGNDVVDLTRSNTLLSYVESSSSKSVANPWGDLSSQGITATQYTTKDGLVLVRETQGSVSWYHFGSH